MSFLNRCVTFPPAWMMALIAESMMLQVRTQCGDENVLVWGVWMCERDEVRFQV